MKIISKRFYDIEHCYGLQRSPHDVIKNNFYLPILLAIHEPLLSQLKHTLQRERFYYTKICRRSQFLCRLINIIKSIKDDKNRNEK